MNTFLQKLTVATLPIAVLVLSSLGTLAEETKPAKNVEDHSPAGTWTWERKTGDSMIESKITIVDKEGEQTGKFKDEEHDLAMKNCKLEDGLFSFEVFPHPESPKIAIKFEGKVSADQIKGTMSYTVKDKAKSVPWTAKRFEPANAIVGKWLLEFETPDGTALDFKIQVKKKGKGLGVTFVDDKKVKARKVKYKNGVLTFDSQQEYEGEPISVEWDLSIEGNQATGTLYYAFERAPGGGDAEGEGEIEVTGVRVK